MIHETIKAADAEIGKWYWIDEESWLCVVHDGWGSMVTFYRPGSLEHDVRTDDDIIPLPDDAGYDYELPPAEPDYAELHAKCGLQVGDRVRVTKRTEPNGWDGGWNKFMLGDQLGKCGIITKDCGAAGFRLKVNPFYDEWAFPCTSLEKIEPEYRPFANAAEFEPHEGRRWRYVSDLSSQRRMTTSYNDAIHHADSWDICFNSKVFCDGSPFGLEASK